jgi:hypothetical protein
MSRTYGFELLTAVAVSVPRDVLTSWSAMTKERKVRKKQRSSPKDGKEHVIDLAGLSSATLLLSISIFVRIFKPEPRSPSSAILVEPPPISIRLHTKKPFKNS